MSTMTPSLPMAAAESTQASRDADTPTNVNVTLADLRYVEEFDVRSDRCCR